MPSRPPGLLRALTTPSMLLLHVLGLAAVTVAVLLGQWQIGAWQEKRVDRSAALVDVDPDPLSSVIGPDDPFPVRADGRPVEAEGRWVPDGAVWVDDRRVDDRTGSWLVVPLQVADSGSALPVVLGWTDRAGGPARSLAPAGEAAVTGWLQPGEAAVPDDDPGDDRLPSLRTADLLQRLDVDLYGGYLLLEEPADVRAGLAPVTPDQLPDPPTFTALRNLLYGVEWWVFGGFAVFLWWRWVRDELARTRRIASAP